MKSITIHLIIVFLLSLVNTASYCQSPILLWQKALGGTDYDQAESIQQTFDGGYIVAGISTSVNGDVTGNHGFGDAWIVKLDTAATIEWQHSYGGSADDGAFAIEQTSDSGYIVAATSTSNNGDVTGNHGGVDCWIFKINSTGALEWQKSYGGSSIEIPYDIHSTNDHGFIFAGYTNSNNGDITLNHGFDDYWIVKTDSAGNIQWQKSFGGSDQDHALSVQQTTDGGYLAGGFSNSLNGDVTLNNGSYDYWIIKLDSAGSLLWQQSLGGSLDDKGQCLALCADGGFVISGFTASSDSDVTFNHGYEDLWMVKFDSSGLIQWEKSFGGSGVDQAYSIKQITDGGYIAAGSSYSLDGDVTGNHGGYDYWVLKTDSAGALEWEKSLGGSSVEEAYCIRAADSNAFIIAGGTLSNDGDVTGNHGDFDYWITKINSNTSTGTDPSAISNNELKIYPNPAHDYLNIQRSSSLHLKIKISDTLGNSLAETFAGNIQKLDTHLLPAGLFIIEVTNEKGETARKKFIKN